MSEDGAIERRYGARVRELRRAAGLSQAGLVLDRGENDEADLANGDRVFTKTPAEGETVRVLVPYVTPEAAHALVASELGGRA